jgi:hypothetical protein
LPWPPPPNSRSTSATSIASVVLRAMIWML